MISFVGLSQQELFDNDWMLNYMVIDGKTINLSPSDPTPSIVFNDSSTGFEVYATVDGFNYFAEFAPPTTFNQDHFIIHEGTVSLGNCNYCELESQYLSTILIGFERKFNYEIITESNGNKTLTIITPEGNTAVFGNYSLSIADLKKNNIKVYPNPINNLLFIESKELAIESVKVFSLLGTNVFETKNLYQNSPIDVSFLKNGIYFTKIILEKGNSNTYKFTKE